MDTATLEELHGLLDKAGPDAALERLGTRLRDDHDYEALFYARLLAARVCLGVSPIPTGPVSDIPDDKQVQYEDAIRAAAREVGELFLRQGNLGQAYGYFRMIGETAPLKQALADHVPREDEDYDTLVKLSLYEGLLPRRGFDWVLERFGLCSAITTLGGQQLPIAPEERRYCVGRVVRTLHEELRDRLAADIQRQEGTLPPEMAAPAGTVGVLSKMMAGRDWLFGEDCYHVDLSHLSSAVQMSLDLEPGVELQMARELCAYGQRLSGAFKNPGDPPFDEPYKDHDVYLAILAGENVEAGLAHFRAKADQGTDDVGTGPAEVLVQLLQKLGRTGEALEVARRHLARSDNTWLTYLADLCRKANDYRVLADVAREQGNGVQYLAGLLAARGAAESKKR